LDDGCVAEEVCYWRDMTLVPHLGNLFTKRQIRGQVSFGSPEVLAVDRKTLALRLHAKVEALRDAQS
ncbi:MAG TPA: hypothetical protein VGQ82_12180, partial [Chthoniobacterales bacterium]|nr:hypothetical protein [Chthoniobacterales bacterium]